MPAYGDYLSESYWPAFSRLDEAGQRAFWQVLGAKEVDMTPRIAIVVRGGVVQEVASDTPDILIKLLNMDSLDEGDPPDEWRPPDVVINNSQDFEAYTSGGYTPERNHPLSLTLPHPSVGCFFPQVALLKAAAMHDHGLTFPVRFPTLSLRLHLCVADTTHGRGGHSTGGRR